MSQPLYYFQDEVASRSTYYKDGEEWERIIIRRPVGLVVWAESKPKSEEPLSYPQGDQEVNQE